MYGLSRSAEKMAKAEAIAATTDLKEKYHD
jgi:hypothetical protein